MVSTQSEHSINCLLLKRSVSLRIMRWWRIPSPPPSLIKISKLQKNAFPGALKNGFCAFGMGGMSLY